MKSFKLFFAVLLAVVVFGVFTVFADDANAEYSAAPEGSTTITILHTNDIHGRFVGSGTVIGMDTVGAIHAAIPNSILVDAGDTIHGLPFVTLNQGMNAIQLMNAAGYSLFTPGNHDFNFGIERLLLLETYAEFGFIAANLSWEADGSSVFTEYNIIEIDGIRVGFFGLVLPETPSVTSPLGVIGLDFSSPIVAAQRSVAALQAANVDVIIALAHLGSYGGRTWAQDVARAVPEIDIIIDGHCHTALHEGLWIDDVLLAQAGAHGAFVGAIEIVLYEGKIISRSATLISRAEAAYFTPIDSITEQIEIMLAELDEELSVVIGYSPVTLFGDDPQHRPALRSREVPLGNLFADAMLLESGAQIAMMNSGGIRYHLHAGEVTRHDMEMLHSFSNYVVAVEMTPAMLFYTLDVGIGQPGHGRFPQIGGFSFVFDNTRAPGERILNITLDDGTQLYQNDTTTIIKAAISSFMSSGGDDYTMLVDLPRVGEFGILQDVLATFINYADLTAIAVEGRIVDAATIVEAIIEEVIEEEPAPTPAPLIVEEEPAPTPAPAPVAIAAAADGLVSIVPPAPVAGQALLYTVQPGETLWSIAFNFYGSMQPTVVNRILAANRDVLPSARALRAGMVLTLPAQGLRDPISRTHLDGAAGLYLVQSGDTLGSIASRFLGSAAEWRRIYEANRARISNPNRIYTGQWLVIPG